MYYDLVEMRYLILWVLLVGCTQKKNINEESLSDSLAIYLQPYGDFSQIEAEGIVHEINRVFSILFDAHYSDIKVLTNKPLPKNAYYSPRERHLANYLLRDIKAGKQELTHRDISYNIHGKEHYGIIGLTPVGEINL